MKRAYEVASSVANQQALKNKDSYGKKIRECKIEVGDTVLVRKVGFTDTHKLADKWENEPYKVISQPHSDTLVFKVKLESGKGSTRTLHRNMLLPFNTITTSVIPTKQTTSSCTSQNNTTHSETCSKSESKYVDESTNTVEISDRSDTFTSESESETEETYQKYIIPQRRHKRNRFNLVNESSNSNDSSQQQQSRETTSSQSTESSQQNSSL